MSKTNAAKVTRRKKSDKPPNRPTQHNNKISKGDYRVNLLRLSCGVVIVLAVASGVILLSYPFFAYLWNTTTTDNWRPAINLYKLVTSWFAVPLHVLGAVPMNANLSVCVPLSKYSVTDHREKGLHSVCIVRQTEKIYLIVRKDLNLTNELNFTLCGNATTKQLREAFDALVIDRRPTSDLARKYQPAWQLYSMDGQKLETIDQAITANSLFLMEGGVWVYPAVEVGFVQNVMLDIGNVSLTTRSISPVVLQVSKLLTDDEIDYVIDTAAPFMSSSSVTPNEGDADKDPSEWRTSSSTWLRPDHVVEVIDHRVSVLTHIPVSHQEMIQVLKYTKGQQYIAHHDYFDLEWMDKDTMKAENWEQTLNYGYANRHATVFWYMSDVEEGGETWFAQTEKEARMADPTEQCKSELMVKPVKGAAIIFYDMLPSGEVDVMSKHAGCPVIKGTKHAANKWVWSRPFNKV